MPSDTYLFTSESVSEGHPDKVSDQISDGIVDLYLGRDPEARVAVETLTTTNRVVLAGETRCAADVSADEMIETARRVIKKIGYEQEGFHWEKAAIDCYVHEQSTEIAQGVDSGEDKEEGAGDQGLMFGFACDETPELMPAPIAFSHRIVKALADARHSGRRPEFQPDAKSQVTLRYENGRPVTATSVVVSTQHQDGLSQDDIRQLVRPFVLECLPDADWMCAEEDFYVNPTGKFVIGGPDGDAGLTGRKIIVDTYGGAAPHGGGAFSGKDPTKVDRSAAYACRYLAKNVVAAGLARKCLIQVSYAIGIAKPLSVYVDLTDGEVDPSKLEKVLSEVMDLRPKGIRTHLGLNKPIYERSAAYGHFGREPDADGGFSWEKTDLVDELKRAFS
ncbi:methionine adenosyltransferase [Parvularcula marina]|uniref:S-adenosylmethionine synthase n=1 Tax=Parvularcula marina TaxID=2292771 RepID=A0A371RIW4_9PROT|nr:methionine adenosyltransferase [Parvularcula marina]RFB05393.1 methionine adenosyltransferase [Parvularcula marina]